MALLSFVTMLVNLVALLLSLWLGLYLVTRSGRSRTAWLGSATLWAIGAWFLHNALQGGITSRVWIDWLGQAMKLSVPLWFHLASQVRFAIAPPSQHLRRTTNVLIAVSYALVVFQILESAGALGTSVPETLDGPAILFSDRWITSSFPVFLTLLTVLPALALIYLWLGWRATPHLLLRQQLNYLLLAAIVAYASGLYAGFAVLLQVPLPVFPADAGLGVSVFLLGFGVASYNALLQGRPVGRDALYSAVGLLAVVVIYSVVVLLLYQGDQLTLPAMVVVLVAVVITHALYDGGRAVLDRLFYHANTRHLRAELRNLSSEANIGDTLAQRLEHMLDAARQRVETAPGCVAVRQGEHFVVMAASTAEWLNCHLPLSAVQAESVRALAPGEIKELAQMRLLVPLFVGLEQVGALLLGARPGGGAYPLADQHLLEMLADPMATLLQTAQLQEAQAERLDRILAEFHEREQLLQQQQQAILAPPIVPLADMAQLSQQESVLLVEKALRRLHDFGSLSTSPLAKLKIVEKQVDAQMAGKVVTPVDRGKVLAQVLGQAVEKLRPDAKLPPAHEVPGREWYAYLILHHSYVLEVPTRDIMNWLYISEGNYNRTRRVALHTLTTTLLAMEEAAHREA